MTNRSLKMPHTNHALLLAVGAALAIPLATTHAQWLAVPVDNNYSNTNNWTGGTINGTFGDSSIFAVNVPNAGTGQNLLFNGTNTSYTLASTGAGTFAFGNGGGITVNNTVTANQNINLPIGQVATNTLRTVFLASSAINGAQLIVNGNYTGGSSVAGLSTQLRLTGVQSGVINGVISDGALGGGLLLQKTGGAGSASTFALNGANTYSTGTEVGNGSGTLILGNKSALGTGQLRIIAGGTFQSNQSVTPLTGANAVANVINYVGNSGTNNTTSLNFTTGSNIATLNTGVAPAVGDLVTNGGTGLNFVPFYTRVTAVSGSNITFSNNAVATGISATNTTAAFTSAGSATTNISGTNPLEFSGAQNLTTTASDGTAATQTFNVTNTALTTFSGALGQQGGVASVAKTGIGALALTGANTYTGSTTVTTGTLLINNASGSGTGTGAVTVAAGAILGGSGSIAGLTTISGSLRPGNSIGTLTVNNNVTWNSGTPFQFELGSGAATIALANVGGSTQDLLNISNAGTGNFVKGTGAVGTFTFDFLGTGGNGVYKLVDWDGTTTFAATDFAATNLPGSTTFTFTVDPTTTALYLTVVPEPSTYALMASGAGMLFLVQRRRRQS